MLQAVNKCRSVFMSCVAYCLNIAVLLSCSVSWPTVWNNHLHTYLLTLRQHDLNVAKSIQIEKIQHSQDCHGRRRQRTDWLRKTTRTKNTVRVAIMACSAVKPSVAYVRSQRQYCVMSEDRHIFLCLITLTFDLCRYLLIFSLLIVTAPFVNYNL